MNFQDKGGQEEQNLVLGEDEEEEPSASDAMSCLVLSLWLCLFQPLVGGLFAEGEIIQEVHKEERDCLSIMKSDRNEEQSSQGQRGS